MFDAKIRPLMDPPLNRLGQSLAARGVSADAVTWAAFGVGMAAAVAIVYGLFVLAALLIALSRLGDGLDGAIARATRKTDFGGFLDIVLDFIFYAAVPLAFAIHAPAENALAAAVLLASFFANGTSFLAFAIMAAKRGVETTAQGQKSLFYMAGLAEGAETIVVLLAVCLAPGWFVEIAFAYAAVCFVSAAARVALARRVLADEPQANPETQLPT